MTLILFEKEDGLDIRGLHFRVRKISSACTLTLRNRRITARVLQGELRTAADGNVPDQMIRNILRAVKLRLIVLGFNGTSTLLGHFVSSPKERKKREGIVQEMKERGREERQQEWKWRNRRNKKNTPPPLYLPLPATRIAVFYGHSLPSADSRRAVVSFWRKNVHNTG